MDRGTTLEPELYTANKCLPIKRVLDSRFLFYSSNTHSTVASSGFCYSAHIPLNLLILAVVCIIPASSHTKSPFDLNFARLTQSLCLIILLMILLKKLLAKKPKKQNNNKNSKNTINMSPYTDTLFPLAFWKKIVTSERASGNLNEPQHGCVMSNTLRNCLIEKPLVQSLERKVKTFLKIRNSEETNGAWWALEMNTTDECEQSAGLWRICWCRQKKNAVAEESLQINRGAQKYYC